MRVKGEEGQRGWRGRRGGATREGEGEVGVEAEAARAVAWWRVCGLIWPAYCDPCDPTTLQPLDIELPTGDWDGTRRWLIGLKSARSAAVESIPRAIKRVIFSNLLVLIAMQKIF